MMMTEGKNMFTISPEGIVELLDQSAKEALSVAERYADYFTDVETGLINGDEYGGTDTRGTLYCAIGFLMSGKTKRIEQGHKWLDKLGVLGGHFNVMAGLMALYHLSPALSTSQKENFQQAVKGFLKDNGEDIIAGRNNNIPLGNWTGRLAAGLMFDDTQLVDDSICALEKFVDLVEPHGTLPEFNSPTYHPVTLLLLRIICQLGEPRATQIARKLENHLWLELAWRWHPRIRQLCGPWGRAYHDSLYGGSGLVSMLADLLWGGFYNESVAYQFVHAHDHAYASLLVLLAHQHPVDVSNIALHKPLPATVTSSAEQSLVKLGDDDSKITWIPGGISELTTWMDENLSVATATKTHVHGMQNASYIAQWTRTGESVKTLSDLGQAFVRFVQNQRRPGQTNRYLNHHHGQPIEISPKLWADDGRPSAVQSGSSAVIVYQPKRQERWTVERLEMFVVLPRLDTIDQILVNGKTIVGNYIGEPYQSVVIRSGLVSLGVKFTATDTAYTNPLLIIESSSNHLLVGLKLVEFTRPTELPESVFRRYGGCIGTDLRYTPTQKSVDQLVLDMTQACLADKWEMAVFGGHREIKFQIGNKNLMGRFEPISESWLDRRFPLATGHHEKIKMAKI